MAAGKYQYVKKLATGGMAEVWLARQTGIEGFNRHVVVKKILPHLAEDAEFVQMFLNEAKIAARFNHPNIAQIYELGEENGTYFIAMEYIHGEDLGRVMRTAWSSGQWVARHIALRIVADACQGLHYAHTRTTDTGQPARVVHRDISPQNILVSFDGAVKVVDFGIAKASDQMSNTKSGAIKGKFAYMAPEQAGGKNIDARSDVYALGLVLYELVTGVRPLKRESELATLQAALAAHIDPPSVVAEVPTEIDDVVMRALAKVPDDRYRDAREFHKAIEEYLVDHGEMATSLQVSELMETLFADRLSEEQRTGVPSPATASSTHNKAALSSSGVRLPPEGAQSPPLRTPKKVTPPPRTERPNQTLDVDPGERGRGATGAGRKNVTQVSVTLQPHEPDPEDHTRALAETNSDLPPVRERVEDSISAPTELPPEEPAPEPPRRASRVDTRSQGGERRLITGQMRAKREREASLTSMPEAPARRAKVTPPPPLSQVSGEEKSEISQIVDVKSLRRQARSRLVWVIMVVVLVALGALGFVFKDRIQAALLANAPLPKGLPVLLQVTTNPPTTVWVVPPKGSGRQPVNLGQSGEPELSGAYVGDLVVLVNEDRGIRFERRIDQAEANKPIVIAQKFSEVTVKVSTKPRLKSATIVRLDENGKQVQRLGQVGLGLVLFQGTHRLAVSSDQLANPVPFELVINEGQKSAEQVVDVSAEFQKP